MKNKLHSAFYAEWLANVEKRASEIDALYDSMANKIHNMPVEMLHYLIHFNNGMSGPIIHPLTTLYEAEAKRRGEPYTSEIGDMIDNNIDGEFKL